MTIELCPLEPADRETFIHDLQESFAVALVETYGEQAADLIPRHEIEASLDACGAESFHIMANGQKAGGVVLIIDRATRHNKLELLFINPAVHSKGLGLQTWKLIEATYPDTLVWETITPYFEKRNIHFYVNKCGFCIVEFFNPRHRAEECTDMTVPGKDYYFRFAKRMMG